MFTGGSSHEPAPASVAPPQQPQQTLQQPCEIEWRQFLEWFVSQSCPDLFSTCSSQTQPDLNLCQSYNDLFKQCKARIGS